MRIPCRSYPEVVSHVRVGLGGVERVHISNNLRFARRFKQYLLRQDGEPPITTPTTFQTQVLTYLPNAHTLRLEF